MPTLNFVADSTQSTGLKWAAASSGGLTLITPTSTANSGGTVTTSGGLTTFSAGTSISLNGVFSSTYDNYMILLDEMFFTGTAGSVLMRMRASGTDTTTGYYQGSLYILWSNGTTGTGNTSNGSSWDAGGANIDRRTSSTLFVHSPNRTKETSVQYLETRQDANNSGGGILQNNTAYDGVTFYVGSDSISLRVRVYGIAN